MRRPLLCFLVLGCALLWATRSRVAEASGYDLTGRRAPDFHIESGLHGISAGQTLASFRGEVVVVKFFFSGCPACRASLPEYGELHRRYAGRPVRFIGIADDSYANMERLFESSGYTFPVGIDPSGVTSASYGVRSYPTH